MKCPFCQIENPEGTKFCGKCGIRLALICPKCGKVNPPTNNFCGGCGSPLAEKGEAEWSKPAMEAERKQVTVLFSDLSGYTAMTERLDPEEVHQILDGCFQILMAEIHRYEGTINQFTGDGVMALFGVEACFCQAIEGLAGRR
jgi:ribosomal protein L37E